MITCNTLKFQNFYMSCIPNIVLNSIHSLDNICNRYYRNQGFLLLMYFTLLMPFNVSLLEKYFNDKFLLPFFTRDKLKSYDGFPSPQTSHEIFLRLFSAYGNFSRKSFQKNYAKDVTLHLCTCA